MKEQQQTSKVMLHSGAIEQALVIGIGEKPISQMICNLFIELPRLLRYDRGEISVRPAASARAC
jgi:hypothetical protein